MNKKKAKNQKLTFEKSGKHAIRVKYPRGKREVKIAVFSDEFIKDLEKTKNNSKE